MIHFCNFLKLNILQLILWDKITVCVYVRVCVYVCVCVCQSVLFKETYNRQSKPKASILHKGVRSKSSLCFMYKPLCPLVEKLCIAIPTIKQICKNSSNMHSHLNKVTKQLQDIPLIVTLVLAKTQTEKLIQGLDIYSSLYLL